MSLHNKTQGTGSKDYTENIFLRGRGSHLPMALTQL